MFLTAINIFKFIMMHTPFIASQVKFFENMVVDINLGPTLMNLTSNKNSNT